MSREGEMTGTRIRLPAAERRETILRAATEVFAEVGYRAAKVSDVAKRVGVTEPVIFQNFGSKAALFAAVLKRAVAEARASLDDFASSSASDLLEHVLLPARPGTRGRAKADHGKPHEGTEYAGAAYGVLFADAVAMAAEPALAEAARLALQATASHLSDLIRRAQNDGGVSPDLDPEAAAWLLLSFLSACRLRAAAMPPHLEPAVANLALAVLAPHAASAGSAAT
jgi:AcrR family transcriptional regulator